MEKSLGYFFSIFLWSPASPIKPTPRSSIVAGSGVGMADVTVSPQGLKSV